jgi:hypothetical protein
VPTSKQVMKFSGHYVKIDGDTKSFDWKGFTSAVNNYTGDTQPLLFRTTVVNCYTGDELTFDKVQDNTINQQEATVKVMVDKITKFLSEALSVALSAKDIEALAANIETTFTNLKSASETGFASFHKSSSASNSSWEYRVLFAFPNEDLPTDFYSLVTTILLTANIKEESSWWGLVSSTSKNFGANITAMELVVSKGFRDPTN